MKTYQPEKPFKVGDLLVHTPTAHPRGPFAVVVLDTPCKENHQMYKLYYFSMHRVSCMAEVKLTSWTLSTLIAGSRLTINGEVLRLAAPS